MEGIVQPTLIYGKKTWVGEMKARTQFVLSDFLQFGFGVRVDTVRNEGVGRCSEEGEGVR